MERRKTNIVKSKSSNSAITTKSEGRKNKLSRSNAEIQPLSLKKRGVYVEKKATTVSVIPQVPNVIKKQMRPPPIPRPNRKRFLNSVLTILSKSTAGTQYPDHDEGPINRRCEKMKFKGNKNSEDDIVPDIGSQNTSKKKPKYRSKILNARKNDLEQLVVLQSKKEIVHTPSNNSQSTYKEPDTIKWSEFLQPLVKPTTKEELEKSIYENSNEGIAKQVLEGMNMKEKRVKLVDSELEFGSKKEESGLYNYFVDLLETTFSIYNVKTEYDDIPTNRSTSNIGLEIDESVAKRLNFTDATDNVAQGSKHFCCVPENDWDKDLIDYFDSENNISNKSKYSPRSSKHFKTQSLRYTKPKSRLPTTQSYIESNATHKRLKRSPKKELLNSIKHQLRKDVDTFEEPQNLYQALRLIARNKRKYQKTIHFDETTRTDYGSNDSECVFKRRKVISFSKKSSAKKSTAKPETNLFRSINPTINYADGSSTIKRAFKSDIVTDESDHSLEVYGFDYEEIPNKRCDRLKEIVLTYHSTPAQSEQDYNINEALLKCSDSGTSSMKNYINWNRGITSVTTVTKYLKK